MVGLKDHDHIVGIIARGNAAEVKERPRSDTDLTSAQAGMPGASASSRVAALVTRARNCAPPMSMAMRSESASSSVIARDDALEIVPHAQMLRHLRRHDEVAREQLHAQRRARRDVRAACTLSSPRPPVRGSVRSLRPAPSTTPSRMAPTASGPMSARSCAIEAHCADAALRDHGTGLHQHDVGREPQHLVELVAHVHHRNRQPVAQAISR